MVEPGERIARVDEPQTDIRFPRLVASRYLIERIATIDRVDKENSFHGGVEMSRLN